MGLEKIQVKFEVEFRSVSIDVCAYGQFGVCAATTVVYLMRIRSNQCALSPPPPRSLLDIHDMDYDTASRKQERYEKVTMTARTSTMISLSSSLMCGKPREESFPEDIIITQDLVVQLVKLTARSNFRNSSDCGHNQKTHVI